LIWSPAALGASLAGAAFSVSAMVSAVWQVKERIAGEQKTGAREIER